MNIELNSNEARLVNDALFKLIELNKKEAYKAEYYAGHSENPEEKVRVMMHNNFVIENILDKIGII